MAIVFHLISAAWPSSLNCTSAALSETEGSEEIIPQPLNSLNPMRQDCTEKGLETLRQKFEQEEDWAQLTIVESVRCSRIQKVSFMHKEPDKPHVIYMMRSTENEDLSKSTYFAVDFPGNYHFILGVKSIDRIFLLAQTSLKATLQEIEMEDTQQIERVLRCFQQEATTTGIVLTIQERPDHIRTYIWLK
jgi:hypothetical protein